MVSRIAASFLAHHSRLAFRTHDDLVLGILKVLHFNQALAATSGKQGSFIDQIGQISTGETWCATRQNVSLDVWCNRHLAHVHIEDLFATANVRQTTNPSQSKPT